MFLKEDNKDISQEFYNEVSLPYLKEMDDYLENNIIPVVVAHYIATGYRKSALYEDDYCIHITSGIDLFFNFTVKNKSKLKKRVKDILLNEYNLKLIKEKPLLFEDYKR